MASPHLGDRERSEDRAIVLVKLTNHCQVSRFPVRIGRRRPAATTAQAPSWHPSDSGDRIAFRIGRHGSGIGLKTLLAEFNRDSQIERGLPALLWCDGKGSQRTCVFASGDPDDLPCRRRPGQCLEKANGVNGLVGWTAQRGAAKKRGHEIRIDGLLLFRKGHCFVVLFGVV